jgi:4-alpha-glucanotransferase
MPDALAKLPARGAGILLHPAALGPGALGEPAHRFVDWLAAAGIRAWQMLPLGPVGEDGSPYWVRSDFAGNTQLLPPESSASPRGFAAFCRRESAWLTDFALHSAIARREGPSWLDWPTPLRDREPQALADADRELRESIRDIQWMQWRFDVHWRALRRHAARRGIAIIGDLPMYVAPDSVETWAHRREFRLLPDGRPAVVAGVPPDYFSADGQLWGNPVYDWSQAALSGFAHFRHRVRAALRRADLLRIDHFRALAAHWIVPAGARDARAGQWHPTPGHDLLGALRTDCPEMPFIAEDLGDITPDVLALRDHFDLPGMQVLQFAFDGDPANPHAARNFRVASVAYLGTHDNDTTLGWMLGLDSAALRAACAHYAVRPAQLPGAMRSELLRSRARLVVLTVPDLLGLGSEARYNTPGRASGNWSWQLPDRALGPDLARSLRHELVAADRVQGP